MNRTPYRNAWSWLEFESALLQENRLDDRTLRRFPVYLPPQYTSEPTRRFPVVYYLIGYSGWGAMKLLEEKPWEVPLWARLDKAMRAGEMEPMIVVFPDCFTRFGGAQYRDSVVTGPYASYLCQEVVPLVDVQFRTLADRNHRALMGKSSGGYGALHLAMTRPEIFGLCCATAADSYFELSYVSDFAKALQAYHAAGSATAFVENFFAGKPRHKQWMAALSTIAYAQAYTPNPDVPMLQADLPFDLQTGELVPEIWQRWLACDPVRACEQHAVALRGLKLLFLDAGTSDEFALNFGHRVLADRLRKLDVPFEFEEFDGGHMGIDHRIDASLLRITAALRRADGMASTSS
jgi:enterochelin esterase-like enzyme